MSAFDDTKVHAAIARLPRLGSKEVREMKSRAQKQNLPALEAACEAELAARPVEFSGEDALRFEEMAGQVAGLSLTEAIRHAFTSVRRADPDEVRCLRWIAAHPGGTFQAALQAFGKGDLSLVIGHLAYQRLGCFRAFIAPGEDQSSVLLSKDRSGKSVCYTLRPEAETVFGELGLLG